MKILIKAIVFSSLLVWGQASAVIVESIHLDFASGAVFDGTVTFNDGYQGMIDTEGYLVGGSNGFNEYFHWTWWQGVGQVNPQDSNSDGLLNDWLMNGVDGGSYSMYIGLSWDDSASVLLGGIDFAQVNDAYYNGNSAYQDLIVGWSKVPEASSLALLGLGLFGLVASRKRKA